MATAPRRLANRTIDYPTGDCKPMAESDVHRDVLKVPEYFQFDPTEDYLKPPLQGFRLVGGEYVPIEPVAGRLPSQILGLHLERDGKELRLYNPATGSRLLKRDEQRDEAKRRALAAETDRQRLAAENERLRKEIEAMSRRVSPQ